MRTIFILIILILSTEKGFAQEYERPVEQTLPAPDWKEGLKKGKVDGWLYFFDDNQEERSTSSYKEKYPLANLFDRNSSTAWVEGEAGHGIGEVVVIDFSPTAANSLPLRIWAGYGKSQNLFLKNNRPKKIKIYLLGTFCHDCTPRVCMQGQFSVVSSVEKELKDFNGFQEIPVPEIRIDYDSTACAGPGGYERDAEHYIYKIAIQILSVYKGTKYEDTCISEFIDNYYYTEWLKKNQK
jgi:hypothetical protein